jgi:hypothetical protein
MATNLEKTHIKNLVNTLIKKTSKTIIIPIVTKNHLMKVTLIKTIKKLNQFLFKIKKKNRMI